MDIVHGQECVHLGLPPQHVPLRVQPTCFISKSRPIRIVSAHNNKQRIVALVLAQTGHWCSADSGLGPSFGAHSAVPEHYEEVLCAKLNLAMTQLVDEELNPAEVR